MKNRRIEVGSHIRIRPTIADGAGKGIQQPGVDPKEREAIVIWVHPARRFAVLEWEAPLGRRLRECIPLTPGARPW